ncbi:homeobox protein CDX-4-like [Dreissena polymorpha]|uniref:Homeobox domain-containing protein n=1 Tax=Dreissena polymorpha TaxID=45954 RepID=A0A9D4QPI8_DREPO|nr:homeobox protein CDX-4-like [Dreissena polymorpha]KAH3838786.1 hypothetical protein DPMN_112201 [Dreissena polymorpha]
MKAQGIQQLSYQLVNSRPLSLDSTLTSHIFGAMPTSTAGSVRYRPYMDRDVTPINGQTRFSDYKVRNSSAYSCKYSQQRTAGECYSQLNYDYAGPYMGYDHSYLSTLRSLQEVCSIGTTINGLACLSDTSMPSISPPHGKHNPDAVASAKGSMNSVAGSTNCEHPFYARRSAATPADGMTRTRDKHRVVYTDKQRKGLERAYDEDKFITMEARDKLSKELELSDRQVQILLT